MKPPRMIPVAEPAREEAKAERWTPAVRPSQTAAAKSPRKTHGVGHFGLSHIGLWLLLSVFSFQFSASGQPQVPPPPTTTFTRQMLTNTDAAGVRAKLGFLSTNNTSITNYDGNGAAVTNLNASQLLSGTIPVGRYDGSLAVFRTNNLRAGTNYSTTNLVGTLDATALVGALPAISGASLTALNADNLASGTIPDARFPAVLPAVDGSQLTGITGAGGGIGTLNGSGTNTTLHGVTIASGNAGGVTNVPQSGDVGSSAFSNWKLACMVLTNSTVSSDPDSYIIRTETHARINGKVFYYYGASSIDDVRGHICAAVGSNFYSLNKIGVVLSNTVGQWDGDHVLGCRMVYENGTNFMFYYGGTNSTGFESATNYMGLAWTLDGTNFTKFSGNPILGPSTTSTDWDHQTLWRPFVIKHGPTYFMFFNAGDSDSIERIGFATAPTLSGPWTKYSGNPVINPSVTASIIADPCILKMKDGTFILVASEVDDSGDDTTVSLITFSSPDLTNWTRVATAAIANKSGFIESPEIFMDDGVKLIWDDEHASFAGELAKSIESTNFVGSFTGNGAGLTNIPLTGLNWSAIQTSAFSNNIAARVPVVIGATTYYLTLSTNVP